MTTVSHLLSLVFQGAVLTNGLSRSPGYAGTVDERGNASAITVRGFVEVQLLNAPRNGLTPLERISGVIVKQPTGCQEAAKA